MSRGKRTAFYNAVELLPPHPQVLTEEVQQLGLLSGCLGGLLGRP